MTVSPASMRALYPALTQVPYTDAILTAWIAQAAPQVNADRWGDQADLGVTLLAAHLATLALRQAGGAAGIAGNGAGAVTSKAVDKVSVSYDVTIGMQAGAGWFGSTAFGNQFYYYLQIYGAGPIQASPFGYTEGPLSQPLGFFGAFGWA